MLKGSVVPLVFAGWLLSGFAAHGLTFFVTQTNDSTDETSLSGALLKKIKMRGAVIPEPSLRGAIIAANRRGGFNTILLQPKTYQLSLAGADEDEARTGDLDITRGNLTVMVVGKGNATINAAGVGDRVFQVFPKASLTLANLTIAGGTAPNGSAGDDSIERHGEPGGAISNAGQLKMSNCRVELNKSGDGGFMYAAAPSGGEGGGIFNSGIASINKSIITSNSSGLVGFSQYGTSGTAGSDGGGIYNSGTMALSNCLISDNSGGTGDDGSGGGIGISIGSGGAGGHGGGIYNSGKLQINFCTISRNLGGSGGIGGYGGAGHGGDGGGVFNSGLLTLNTCTVSSNSAGAGGLGYGAGRPEWSLGFGGVGGSGGGIYNEGSLNSFSTTIAFNLTGIGGNGGYDALIYTNLNAAPPGGAGGSGGGIYNGANGASVILKSTLSAFNIAESGGQGGSVEGFFATIIGTQGVDGYGPDIFGDFSSHGFNLLSASDGSTGFTNGVNADQVGSLAAPIDPLIGPLQMNGGPTPTHALLPGSPAIDQGKSFGQKLDQRGHHRPHNYPSIPNATGGDGSDIGAFELDN